MKYEKIFLACILLISTMVLSLLGCARANRYDNAGENSEGYPEIGKGYTGFDYDFVHAFIENGPAALGHSCETSLIASATSSQSYTLYTCSRCGYSYRDTFIGILSDSSGKALASARAEVFYSGAVKDYLLPLEDFSVERKYDPEFVMIHFTSAVLQSKDDPYNMDTVRSIFADYHVSVHYIIDRDGTIHCYIPENLVAWHAGAGTWNDDPKYTDKLNDYAIGIEMLAIGSQNDMKQYLSEEAYHSLNQSLIGFTDAQYDSLKELVRDICQRNDIPMDREHIIGQEEYSPQKTDPGELFDWERFLS